MIKHLLRKFRRTGSSPSTTKQRHFIGARLTHERLEPRILMTINPSGAELLVNDIVPGFQGMDRNVSSVAVSEAAGTIATYARLGAGTREGIFLRMTDPTGSQNDVVRVSTTIRGARSAAVVAANEAGDTVAVWQGRGLGDKYGIYLQRLDASGHPLGGEQLVNETIGGKQHDPSVAMAADGSFVVSWSGASTSDSSGVSARRYSADGTPLAGEELVNTTTTERQIESAIAVNSSGDYVITWSSRNQEASDGEASDGEASDWGVFGQRFNAAGIRQGSEFAVNTTTGGSQRESSVAMQDDGTFMVVWSSFGQDTDSWAVVGRRFDATGTAVGGEFIVNASTIGHQRHAQVAGAGGNYLVAWQSGVPGGTSGWEVMAQELDARGTAVGSEITVNSVRSGPHSGHQEHPAVALNSAGSGAIVWSGFGTPDRQGTFGRGFQDDSPADDNLAPEIEVISDQTVAPGTELVVVVEATDPNANDTLGFELDQASLDAGATIVQDATDTRRATLRWNPTEADLNSVTRFRVTVTDDGVPQLEDVEEFLVTVAERGISLDLNGPDLAGVDASASFAVGLGPASIINDELLIVGAADDMLSRVSIQLGDNSIRSQEVLEVDDLFPGEISASYSVGLRRLFLSGVSRVENYQRVLRTLRYNNTAPTAGGTRSVSIQVNDASLLSNKPTVTITLGDADLVGFAQALAATDTQFFGAAWCPHCTDQKELFEDGGQFLPFTEVTNPDRTRNETGDLNEITSYPTWVFPEGSRFEAVLSLEEISRYSGVPIPVSVDPFIAPIPAETLLVGSPRHVSLDGYDPNGGPLTYSVTTNRPADVETSILENIAGNHNRSARINVAGYGDLVFELFEQRASGPTTRFIELASDDLANDGLANNDFFYDDVIFHRVINDFVIQGGDPLGTGSGGTGTDIDDQFHVDLQHNRTGLLSYAKSLEDTNDSQFFITEHTTDNSIQSLRGLDFHHSIFGVLVEGEGNRAAISDTEVIRRSFEVSDGDRRADRPGRRDTGAEFNITMENVEIFEDTENAVLFLKANPGVTGDVIVTVTATDQQGNTFDREFRVTVADDTFNGRPFIDHITAPATVSRGTSAQIQLDAIDVENDAIFYRVETPTGNAVPYTATVDENGLVDITLTDETAGELQISVLVASSSDDFEFRVRDGIPDTVGRRDARIDRQLVTMEVV